MSYQKENNSKIIRKQYFSTNKNIQNCTFKQETYYKIIYITIEKYRKRQLKDKKK